MTTDTIEVRLTSIRWLSDRVNLYEFRPLASAAGLPAATPGAHVDLHLPDGQVRQYSLLPAAMLGLAPDSLSIAVKHDPAGRGGSGHLHVQSRVGQTYRLSAPRNNFELVDDATPAVFIAGGIGITPILSMIAAADIRGGVWQLHYASRNRRETAFLHELGQHGDRVHLALGDDPAYRRLDIAAIVAAAAPGTHFYCCGPQAMLASFETATAQLPPEQVHLEHFGATQELATDGGFQVELARSRKTVTVQPGETILDALARAGVDMPSSCQQGICGACEVKVLAGTPDHRDEILTAAEKAANSTMMICCSGSLGPKLVLDA